MDRKARLLRVSFKIVSSVLLVFFWFALGARSTVMAQATTHVVQAGETLTIIAAQYGVTVAELVAWNDIENPDLIEVGQVLSIAQVSSPAPTPAASTQTVTHTVQSGETLSLLAKQYGTTVDSLVSLNGIEDPNLIDVGQVLTVNAPAGWAPPSAASAPGAPLSFTWSLVDWQPDDPNYVATLNIQAQGGIPPYTFYHDGLVQQGATFDIAWLRCTPKPGSIGVQDASGTYVKEDYYLPAPYCPLGVEIVEPAEGAQLENYPRQFNITWKDTVDPPPSAYGIEIEVWDGDWKPWKQYVYQRSSDRDLFFVPDEFPGDLGGRVRMWGIYGGHESETKTPWRYFEFRVTY
jgi:LysM repeat protein